MRSNDLCWCGGNVYDGDGVSVMLDNPLEKEMQRAMWEEYYKEHPDADPIKIMATMFGMIWLSGMIMCGVLLIVSAFAWFFGVL